jgi:alkaline phosphatase D
MLASRATWKVIGSDMPLGLIVRDGANAFENAANGDGPPLGRELEIAELLKFLKAAGVRTVVWLTADVHYAASHYYDPTQARFQDFDPFWEFVSGPLHAGTFGPGALDDTFGPQVRFCSVPQGMRPNRPPSEGLQFFGLVQIDGPSAVMTVSHYNVAGDRLWSVDLEPQ